jgi:hypothetical protein
VEEEAAYRGLTKTQPDEHDALDGLPRAGEGVFARGGKVA